MTIEQRAIRQENEKPDLNSNMIDQAMELLNRSIAGQTNSREKQELPPVFDQKCIQEIRPRGQSHEKEPKDSFACVAEIKPPRDFFACTAEIKPPKDSFACVAEIKPSEDHKCIAELPKEDQHRKPETDYFACVAELPKTKTIY